MSHPMSTMQEILHCARQGQHDDTLTHHRPDECADLRAAWRNTATDTAPKVKRYAGDEGRNRTAAPSINAPHDRIEALLAVIDSTVRGLEMELTRRVPLVSHPERSLTQASAEQHTWVVQGYQDTIQALSVLRRATEERHTNAMAAVADRALQRDGSFYLPHTGLGGSMHTHRFQGQPLTHAHPGGHTPHGYYEHPEDGSR